MGAKEAEHQELFSQVTEVRWWLTLESDMKSSDGLGVYPFGFV